MAFFAAAGAGPPAELADRARISSFSASFGSRPSLRALLMIFWILRRGPPPAMLAPRLAPTLALMLPPMLFPAPMLTDCPNPTLEYPLCSPSPPAPPVAIRSTTSPAACTPSSVAPDRVT